MHSAVPQIYMQISKRGILFLNLRYSETICLLIPEGVNPGVPLEAEGGFKGDDEGVPAGHH